jgi:hypothetical protein
MPNDFQNDFRATADCLLPRIMRGITCAAWSLPTGMRLLALASALLLTTQARAMICPISFYGTEQNFDATIDLTGNVFANGAGSVINTKAKLEPFKFTNPLNHPLALYGGPISLSTDPQTASPNATLFEYSGYDQIIDMVGLDVDFLNGQTADFALDTIFLTTNSTVSLLKSISIDVAGTLSGLSFDQTGAATLLGGPGSGTFSVAGDLTATVDNLLAVVFGLLQVPVDSQVITLPGSLTGNWSITGSPINSKVSLDGVIHLDIPISLLTNLTTAITDVLSLTISSTIDLGASLTVDVQYHLEGIHYLCPEPGSVVLLGIGLAAVGGVAVHRRRGRR